MMRSIIIITIIIIIGGTKLFVFVQIIIKVGALFCSKNKLVDFPVLCPVVIQMSGYCG